MSVKKIQNMRRRGSFETLLLCKTSKVGMHERHFERLGINHVSPQPEQFWMALFQAPDGDLDNVRTKILNL